MSATKSLDCEKMIREGEKFTDYTVFTKFSSSFVSIEVLAVKPLQSSYLVLGWQS